MDDWFTTDDVARLLGISKSTLATYRIRYGPNGQYADHPFPQPDESLGRNLLWRADRRDELLEWSAGRPGPGAGGGRPHHVAYAFRDTTDNKTHGLWKLEPAGRFSSGMLQFNPRRPSPFAGRLLEVRYHDSKEPVPAIGLTLVRAGGAGGVLVRPSEYLAAKLFDCR